MTDLDRAVSLFIKERAGRRGLSIPELAHKAGIPETTFRRYYEGQRSFSVGDLALTLTALNVSIEETMKHVGLIRDEEQGPTK